MGGPAVLYDDILGEFVRVDLSYYQGYTKTQAWAGCPNSIKLVMGDGTAEEIEHYLALFRELHSRQQHWYDVMLQYGIRDLLRRETGDDLVQDYGKKRVADPASYHLVEIYVEELRVIEASRKRGYVEGEFAFTYGSELLGGYTGLIVEGTLRDGPMGMGIDLC